MQEVCQGLPSEAVARGGRGRKQKWAGEKLGCDAVAVSSSAHPTGSSGSGMAVQNCLELRQKCQEFMYPRDPSIFAYICPRRGVAVEKRSSQPRHFLKIVYISGLSASNSPNSLKGRTSESFLLAGRAGQHVMVSTPLQNLPTSSNPLIFHSQILHFHNHQVYHPKAELRLCNFSQNNFC